MGPTGATNDINIACSQCGTTNRIDLKKAAERIANCGKCGTALSHPNQQSVGKTISSQKEGIGFLTSFGLVSGLLIAARWGIEYISDPLYRKVAIFLLIALIVSSKTFRSVIFKAALGLIAISTAFFVIKNWDTVSGGGVSAKTALVQIVRMATGYGPIRDFQNQIRVDQYRKYVDAIDSRNSAINTLASLVTQDCPNDHGCQAQKIAQFVSTKINYRSDPVNGPDYIKSPIQTLESRSGDCEDMTILTNSLLGSIGIRTQMVFVSGHVYPRACFTKRIDQTYLDSEKNHLIDGQVCYDLEPTAFGTGLGIAHDQSEEIIAVIDSVTKQRLAPP